MLSRRLQVLIDDERFQRLTHEAARRKVPVSVLVREAIDSTFPDRPGAKAAAARILDADPMPVADPAELRAELDVLRGRTA